MNNDLYSVKYVKHDFHAANDKVGEMQNVVHHNMEMLENESHIVRTNCIDCLDPTNVVQSMLARLNLQAVLVR